MYPYFESRAKAPEPCDCPPSPVSALPISDSGEGYIASNHQRNELAHLGISQEEFDD